MRILCLFKRHYMRKDVIIDRYARLYELPLELARRGHEVLGVCLNYRGRGRPYPHDALTDGNRLQWESYDLGSWLWPGWRRYRRALLAHIETFRPDVLLGGSDALHVALAHYFSRLTGVPFAVDLYDNFDSFGLTRAPGIRPAYHAALAAAGAVTCVSDPLRLMVAARHASAARTWTLESTIGDGLFRPHERAASRRALGLPLELTLVGTAGALSRERGTGTLYAAYERVKTRIDGIALALAGGRLDSLPLPDAADVYYLGELPHERIPLFFSALDVAVICMRDDEFGRYAFPQKAYEIIACGTPLVAADVGALKVTLAEHPDCLYRADDADSLQQALSVQLERGVRASLTPPTWAQQAERLDTILQRVVTAGPGPL